METYDIEYVLQNKIQLYIFKNFKTKRFLFLKEKKKKILVPWNLTYIF